MLKEIIKEMLREELKPTNCNELKRTDSVLGQFLVIGKTYHIRTVTMDYSGTLVAFDLNHLILTDASWVADSGRFNEYLKDTSKINENEPYANDVLVNVQSISDITEIENPYRLVK